MSIVEIAEWDKFVKTHPDAHLLQTASWGEVKSQFGWEAVHLISQGKSDLSTSTAGAQILFRKLTLGFSLAYIPKGPIWMEPHMNTRNNFESIWTEVGEVCREKKAVFLIVEPDRYEGGRIGKEPNIEKSELPPEGFKEGSITIQPKQTIVIDIRGSEQEILSRMKQKTRYNIRLSSRKGVTVSASRDVSSFYKLILTTGGRDSFGVHSEKYYQLVYDCFHKDNNCELLMAYYENEPIAGIMVFAAGKRAWYLYGASSDEQRHRMPNYLLQWEAIRWACNRGIEFYDLWGVPDESESTLEAEFTRRSNGLWGVYRFKRGFGGEVIRSLGPWEQVYSPLLYSIFGAVNKFRSGAVQDY